MAKAKTQAEVIATRCIRDARATMGSGWKHVSHDLRWGLVCQHILGVFLGQDESIDARSVRDYVTNIVTAARLQFDAEEGVGHG